MFHWEVRSWLKFDNLESVWCLLLLWKKSQIIMLLVLLQQSKTKSKWLPANWKSNSSARWTVVGRKTWIRTHSSNRIQTPANQLTLKKNIQIWVLYYGILYVFSTQMFFSLLLNSTCVCAHICNGVGIRGMFGDDEVEMCSRTSCTFCLGVFLSWYHPSLLCIAVSIVVSTHLGAIKYIQCVIHVVKMLKFCIQLFQSTNFSIIINTDKNYPWCNLKQNEA